MCYARKFTASSCPGILSACSAAAIGRRVIVLSRLYRRCCCPLAVAATTAAAAAAAAAAAPSFITPAADDEVAAPNVCSVDVPGGNVPTRQMFFVLGMRIVSSSTAKPAARAIAAI